jgi:hypothetical protein
VLAAGPLDTEGLKYTQECLSDVQLQGVELHAFLAILCLVKMLCKTAAGATRQCLQLLLLWAKLAPADTVTAYYDCD